ncbi:MAG: gluconate 5-dehydrogenase, partial [candidate division Zixibacteria bacterium]|nr:gluconate 5-dehydrogenase [candidate division Zixibacteria bacterium]
MMQPLFDLRDKVALITGSSHGLGFSIARGLGQAGATL